MNCAVQNNNLIEKLFSHRLAKVKKMKPLPIISYQLRTDTFIPDRFEKSETTLDVIRKKCIEAAQSNIKKEVAYIYDMDEDEIIDKYTGSATSCMVNVSQYSNKNLEVHHSHPNVKGIYLPISLDDFKFLNNNEGVNKIVAYGSKGQRTCLTKKKDYKRISEKELYDLEQDLMKRLYLNATLEEREQINKLRKYCEKYPNDSDSVKAKCIFLMIDLQKTANGAKSIDLFWKENAASLNLEYSSNI